MTKGYLITADEIAAMEGLAKVHFQNSNARRINKSLGDLTGLTGLGIHLIEVEPGCETTEFHVHHHEDEAVYILSGTAKPRLATTGSRSRRAISSAIARAVCPIRIHATGTETFRCLVVGQRLDQDIGDYPRKGQRIYRAKGMETDLVDHDKIAHPVTGVKK